MSPRIVLIGSLFPAFAAAQGSDYFPGPSQRTVDNGSRPLTFESVSITPGDAAGTRTIEMSQGSGTFVARNVTLKDLLAYAYGIDGSKLSGGPEWAGTDGYVIEAQAPAAVDPDVHPNRAERVMLRGMLWDLFEVDLDPVTEWHLSLSVDQTTGPTLSETGASAVDEPGIRYEEATDESLGTNGRLSRLIGRQVTLASLADFIAESTGMPVVDRTGLTGVYDFELYGIADATDRHAWSDRLREALGLNLRRVPVQHFVIDSATKPGVN